MGVNLPFTLVVRAVPGIQQRRCRKRLDWIPAVGRGFRRLPGFAVIRLHPGIAQPTAPTHLKTISPGE